MTIAGEEEVCFRPLAQEWPRANVSLKFSYPYRSEYDKRQWHTKPASIPIAAGKITRLLLCDRYQNRNDPHWEKTGWHDMWQLLPPDQEKHCAH